MLGIGIQLPWKQQALGIPRSGLVCWHDLYARYINYYYAVMSSAPVGYWRLGESSGTVAADSSGNGLDGTYIGSPTLGEPGALAGDSDTCPIFDNIDDCVNVPNDAALNFGTGDFTAEVWFKTSGLWDWRVAIGKKRDTGHDAGWFLAINANNQFLFQVRNGSVGLWCTSSATDYLDGAWHYVVARRSAGFLEMFVDGVLLPGSVSDAALDVDTSTELKIGRLNESTTVWNGSLDEVAVYNRALTASEIAAHYAAGLYGRYDAFPDLSGHGNDLQLGSTSGADTNDPSVVVAEGLSFDTDDYALTGNLSGVDMAGEWTAILVGLFNGEAGNPWSLAANDESGQMIRVTSAAGPVLNVAEIGTGSATTANLAVSSMGVVPVVIEARASGFRMYRLDTGATTNTRERHSPVGVPRLGLGCRADASPSSFVDAMTIYSHLFYNRALSNAEIQRIYRSLKATWAARGVTIL